MLWRQYVFRRGQEVYSTWDRLFERRPIRLLFISGRGFDLRAQRVMNAFIENVRESRHDIREAKLLLVGFSGYQLSQELRDQTEENAKALESSFAGIGSTETVSIGSGTIDEDDVSASTSLRLGANAVMTHVSDQTDIILDVSSLPRVVYLALLTGLLHRLIPDKSKPDALFAGGVNLQVLVAEDAALDATIRSEDPSNDLILIPGYSSALHAESFQEKPLVWFPVLGENRVSQLQKVMSSVISSNAEICPILPHPSLDPRRADRLLAEYRQPLFDARETPTANILYAHEAHPFEAYRQLFGAMRRYRDSLSIMGGCRLVVTPLGSKLITLGVGLACFEIRPSDMGADYGIAIPYVEPTRYVVSGAALRASNPEISSLLLTGDAYDPGALAEVGHNPTQRKL
jgi:hypothetical protein